MCSLYSYCIQIKLSFFKNGGQECKTGPVWGLAPVGGGRILKKGYGRMNVVEILCTCIKMER
jgi:hypothetical protein